MSRDDQLQTLRTDIRKCIREAYERNKTQYNLRVRIPAFNIGQEVFRRNFAQSSAEKNFNAKLAPSFLKARIKEKLGSHYYILEDFSGRNLGTYHAKDLRT